MPTSQPKAQLALTLFCAAMYGTHRPILKAALIADTQHVVVMNPHSRVVADAASTQLRGIHFGQDERIVYATCVQSHLEDDEGIPRSTKRALGDFISRW